MVRRADERDQDVLGRAVQRKVLTPPIKEHRRGISSRKKRERAKPNRQVQEELTQIYMLGSPRGLLRVELTSPPS